MSTSATREPKTRGHKKKARTRRALLDAAIAAIGDRGDAFTISDVVERAGVSNGTFYNYFVDRDALVDEVVADILTTFADDSAAGANADPVERFATITASVFRLAAAMPAEMQAILRLDLLQRVVLRDGPLRHLMADLAAGVESGRFDVVHADAVLDVIVGAISMSVRRTLEDGPDPDRDRGLITHLLRALGVDAADASATAAAAMLDSWDPAASAR